MTDNVPVRPRPSDGSRPTILLGDVTASSVTAWSVLGELRPLPALTGAGDSRQLWRTRQPAPPPSVEAVGERTPEPGPQTRQPQTRQPQTRQPQTRQSQSQSQSRELGQQREQRAQRDRQVVAQRARDEDTRQRQVRPGKPVGSRPTPRPPQPSPQGPSSLNRPAQRPGPGRPAQAPARQAQSTVAWTAQPTARRAPQRSTAAGPGGRVGPGAGPRTERSRVSPVRIIGLVVVVLVVAGRCLNGLT